MTAFMSDLSRIKQLRHSGRVQRCHMLGSAAYSLAEHQWNVAMLLWTLWPEDWSRLGIYALTHDVPEGWTGDLPGNVKSLLTSSNMEWMEERLERALRLPDSTLPSEEDRHKLKAADCLELYIWCLEQRFLRGVRLYDEVVVELDALFVTGWLPEKALGLYARLRCVDHADDLRPRINEFLREATK